MQQPFVCYCRALLTLRSTMWHKGNSICSADTSLLVSSGNDPHMETSTTTTAATYLCKKSPLACKDWPLSSTWEKQGTDWNISNKINNSLGV